MLCLQGLNVDEPNVDGLAEGYIEGSVTRSKTSYTVERKTRLLPMVCPRLGVTGVDWFNGWRGACIEADKPKGPGVPMLPAPSVHGWNRVPLRASEGGDWLRKILMAAGHSRDSLSNIGTHSLKATGLSWCAKFGLGHDIRRHLGYHVAKGDHSLLVYSRDAVAQPVREFDRVLRSIRSGCFRPDMTRSGFFRPAVHPEGRQLKVPMNPGHVNWILILILRHPVKTQWMKMIGTKTWKAKKRLKSMFWIHGVSLKRIRGNNLMPVETTDSLCPPHCR